MKEKSFDYIYQSYVRDIFRYLFSLCRDYYLAEDLVNETFYRAYLFLEDYREGRVKPWLFKVAYHAYIDQMRKNRKLIFRGDDYYALLKDVKTPEDALIQSEQIREIGQVMVGLPEKQKQAILLYDFHGLQYKEAAEIMQVSVGHFKVLLFRARQKIRNQRKEVKT